MNCRWIDFVFDRNLLLVPPYGGMVFVAIIFLRGIASHTHTHTIVSFVVLLKK